MKTHRRESLRFPGHAVQAGVQETAREGGAEEPGGGQTKSGGRGGGGGGGSDEYLPRAAAEGLEDMVRRFQPRERRWCRDRRTWGLIRKGREVRSRTDYILGADRRLFRNVAVQESWHNSDHYMVLGCIPSAPLTETKRYLVGRKRWPVRPPREPTRTDELFAALRRAVPRAQPRKARQNAWISESTWRLIDERVSARRDPRYGRAYKR